MQIRCYDSGTRAHIIVDDYDYTSEWFFAAALEFEKALTLSAKGPPIFGLDETILEYNSPAGDVIFAMDNYFAELTFASRTARDAAAAILAQTDGFTLMVTPSP